MAKISKEEYKILIKYYLRNIRWISRNKNRNLVVSKIKPDKSESKWLPQCPDEDWSELRNSETYLFLFIQWKDEEPYNIAELIEEYEYSADHVSHVLNERVKALGNAWKESEETEVNKQKLIEKWESAIESAEFYGKGKEERLVSYMKDFVSDLKKLDEPEVLSQEFIDKYSVTRFHGFNPGLSKYIPVEKLQNLLVPKQELPAIPQWVADNIESKKRVGTRLNVAMSEFPEFKLEKELDIDEHECNEIYARAWIDGYTIKKEPEYNVKFKVKSSFGTVGIFLYKKGDEVLAGDNFEVYYPKEDEFRLTEQEIRGFQNGDVLFEHFAVKVEEEEDD